MGGVLEVTQDCQTITNDVSMTRQQVLLSLIFYVVLKTTIFIFTQAQDFKSL